MKRIYSEGFAAPVLWGVKMAFPMADIAAGLGITEQAVRDIVEQFSDVRFPQPAQSQAPWVRAELPRSDWAYVNWAKGHAFASGRPAP
jgi:hypothetical protein